jgi:putative flippase GtrA
MSLPPDTTFPQRIRAALRRQTLLLKATSFASIGVVNSLVDLALFLLALKFLTSSLIVANVLAWMVAVSGSYAMNSFITFAAESGRRLSGRAYFTFVASQILGLIANTATLVAAAQVMPVLYAKLLAIAVAFIVNFSMSHFVVFRKAAPAAGAKSETPAAPNPDPQSDRHG